MYKEVKKCRICGNPHLERVLDLGEQMLTGVFPREKDAQVTTGPLHLVKCTGEGDICGLLQLEHSYDLGEMYGENYGYRSGLNASMVAQSVMASDDMNASAQRLTDVVAGAQAGAAPAGHPPPGHVPPAAAAPGRAAAPEAVQFF